MSFLLLAMVHEMRKSGLDITIFFYNPNIHPRKEYELRKAENVRSVKWNCGDGMSGL
jgi:predicted adenine nucleotide alpha hydrolase (AANH) superfamily ATPase